MIIPSSLNIPSWISADLTVIRLARSNVCPEAYAIGLETEGTWIAVVLMIESKDGAWIVDFEMQIWFCQEFAGSFWFDWSYQWKCWLQSRWLDVCTSVCLVNLFADETQKTHEVHDAYEAGVCVCMQVCVCVFLSQTQFSNSSASLHNSYRTEPAGRVTLKHDRWYV